MAPLRLLLLISLHLLVAADLYDEPGGWSHGALSLSHEPRDVVVARGQSARLDCLVRQQEAPLGVAWYQDGEPLHLPDQRRQLLANGSLYFDKVLHRRPGRASSDEGVYYCVVQQRAASGEASDAGSFVSRNATVQVAGLARDFTFWPADTTAEAGDSVRFGCWIDSVPVASVDWEKDGAPVEAASEETFAPGSRLVVLRSGALHIYRVAEQDAGNYRCVARNSLAGKERRSPAGRLTVVPASGEQREPIFISPPASASASSGSATVWVTDKSNVTLECLVAARPPVAVRWTLNSSLALAPNFTSGRLSVRPGFLTLTDVEPGMAGDYTCSAASEGSPSGTDGSVTRTTSVRVATVPQFVRAPQSQVFPTAKTVRFECEATGTPVPDIRWLKNGRPLQIGGRIKNKMSAGGASQLVLSNTVTQDSGIYQCQAENRAGLVSAAARLLVNITGRRPEPPSRLRAVPLSASDVVLSWDPPRNVPLDDVTAYTVHYTLLGRAGDETQELALNSSHHVRQLVRNANYSFYVRAYIRRSASDPSERFVFNAAQALAQPPTPAPAAPSRPPAKTLPPPSGAAAPSVTLQPLSPTTLRVAWNRFPSPVSLYKILFRRHNKKEFDIEVVKGDILEYNITGLHPGRRYDVRVAPGSLNVLGPWVTVEMPPVSSEPSTSRAPPAASNPLAAPSLELLAVNHSSVLVTWQDRGPATGRQRAQAAALTYRVLGGRETSERLALPASGARWVGGLRAGTVYEFQVAATSGDEEGPVATRTIRTLWETASGVENEMEEGSEFEQGPVRLDASVLSSSAIRLSWEPVEHADGVLYYTVRYLAAPGGPGVGYVRSTTTDVTLTNLTAHTLYRMSVRAHDREGRLGAFSAPPVERRTLPDVPGVPSDVSWLITPEDQVELTWAPPVEPNGDVVGYAVLVSPDRHSPVDEWSFQEESGSKYRARLRNLTADVPYFVRVQARTQVGWGPPTEPITVQLGSAPVGPATPSTRTDLPAGVIIGLVVALCLTLVVVLSLMLTRRCSKVHSNNRPGSGSPAPVSIDASLPCRPSSGVSVLNGGSTMSNGYAGGRSRAPDRRKNPFGPDAGPRQPGTSLEMEAFFPMLTTIPGDAPIDLDTKGGNPRSQVQTIREEDEEDEADRSRVPLLAPKRGDPRADATVASHATETTCLSLDLTPERRPRRRQDSLHSHDDSSLHSLDDSSRAGGDEGRDGSESASSRSLRGRDDDDTGICHADHHMLNEAGTSPNGSCASANSLNNNGTGDNGAPGNNNNNNNSSSSSSRGTSLAAVVT